MKITNFIQTSLSYVFFFLKSSRHWIIVGSLLPNLIQLVFERNV